MTIGQARWGAGYLPAAALCGWLVAVVRALAFNQIAPQTPALPCLLLCLCAHDIERLPLRAAADAALFTLRGSNAAQGPLTHPHTRHLSARPSPPHTTHHTTPTHLTLLQVCLNNLVVLTSWLRDGLVQLHGLRSPVVTASAALLAVCLWNYFTAKKK